MTGSSTVTTYAMLTTQVFAAGAGCCCRVEAAQTNIQANTSCLNHHHLNLFDSGSFFIGTSQISLIAFVFCILTVRPRPQARAPPPGPGPAPSQSAE